MSELDLLRQLYTTGSITKLILPGDNSGGNVKQMDLPEPVGCTTIASSPLLIVAKQLI